MKEETADGSPYFGTFPSDLMPKATNGVKVHLFIHSCYTTCIISVNSRNILKLLRLGHLNVEQLVLLILHSYFLDDRKIIGLLLLHLQVIKLYSLLLRTLLCGSRCYHNTERERKTIRNDG